MINSSTIKGIYCELNFSLFHNEQFVAQRMVNYFDEKYPQIIKILNNNHPTIVFICFTNEDTLAYTYDTNKIKINLNNIGSNNMGVLTHEGAHVVQSYPQGIGDREHPYWWIMEGLADYVRLKLGWDNPNETPTAFNGSETYKDGFQRAAFFLSWLECKCRQRTFIADINKLVREKCTQQNQQDIDNFFNDNFNETLDALWNNYIRENHN